MSRLDARRGAGAAFALAEFVVIARLEPSFDEAYYVLWSRHLAFGYLDHPSTVAVWTGFRPLFGSAEFGVRALNVVAFALTPAMVGFAAARLFHSLRVGAFAALAWLATPLIAGGFLATPDTPLIFFSDCRSDRARRSRARASLGWAIVGVALGLALQSKFSALFVCAGLARRRRVVALSPRDAWRFSPMPTLPSSSRRRSLRHSSIGTPRTAGRRSLSSSAVCPPIISGCNTFLISRHPDRSRQSPVRGRGRRLAFSYARKGGRCAFVRRRTAAHTLGLRHPGVGLFLHPRVA